MLGKFKIVLLLTLLPLILCEIGSEDNDGYLHYVIFNHSEDHVIRLLNNSCKRGTQSFTHFLEAKLPSGYTPLISAISSGKINIAKTLVKKGANVNARDKFMETPLHHMARSQNQDNAVLILVRMMLLVGANVNAVSNLGFTPFMMACKEGKEFLAMELLKNGAEVHYEDYSSRTALHYAVSLGFKSVVDVLLQKGAKTEKSDWKDNPLLCAIRNEYEDIAFLLLHAGASADIIDEYSLSLLHYETALKNVRLLEKLVSNGAPINSKTINGETPLFIAVYRELKNAVQFFVDAGADINCTDIYGSSPLYLALWNNEESVCIFLASKGADLNVTCMNQNTPLIIAVTNGMIKCANAFLEMGVDPNGKGRHSNTAAHLAASAGEHGLLHSLLQHGCDPNVKNIFGKSPLDMAMNAQSLKNSLAFTLIEAGSDVRDENSKQLLKYFYLSHRDLDKFDIPFDDFIMKVSNKRPRTRKYIISLKLLIEDYERTRKFALYRLLKLRSLKRGIKYVSDLESLKFSICDELMFEITKKTYMEKLPLELVSDAFINAGGYYTWKMERLAWNAALASRYLKTDLKEAKDVARQLSKYL